MGPMTSRLLLLAMAVAVLTPAQERPRILGLAHVAFYVSDLDAARVFYEKFLGFEEEPFVLKKPDGSERIAFIKINDTQYVELFAEEPKSTGRLNHLSIYTDNAEQMRDYLSSKGVTAPEKVGKDAARNKLTYPGLLGVEESRRRAESLGREAIAHLEPLGDDARRLRELVTFVLTRDR